MKVKDVTKDVDFQNPDDEVLPLTKCVCGHTFHAWDFIISIYSDEPRVCDYCGAKLYFANTIQVYQVIDE